MLPCAWLPCHIIGLLLILRFLFADARRKVVILVTHNRRLCNFIDTHCSTLRLYGRQL